MNKPRPLHVGRVASRALVMSAILCAAGAAQAQSASVDFPTLANSPTSGTLANGVTYSVAGSGTWEHITDAPGYDHYTFSSGTQTWTFGTPVNISFTIAGLNCAAEGIQFGGGTAVNTALGASHSWNAGTQLVANAQPALAANGAITSSFTMANTTSLTLTINGSSGCRRGLNALTVTPVAATGGATQAVPVNDPLALLALSGALAGVGALVARRRKSR